MADSQKLLDSILNCLFFKKKELSVPFSWIGFNCGKVAEPLQANRSRLFTKSPGVPGTHLLDIC